MRDARRERAQRRAAAADRQAQRAGHLAVDVAVIVVDPAHVTVNDALVALPLASVAVHTTSVVPTAKFAPDGGAHCDNRGRVLVVGRRRRRVRHRAAGAARRCRPRCSVGIPMQPGATVSAANAPEATAAR